MSENENKCPMLMGMHSHKASGTTANQHWWPNQLNLNVLKQNSSMVDPMDEDFDYIEEVKKLDVDALKKDMEELMTTSQEWWPADYGHYGPFFIRMAWHSAGTYRVQDGRGGGASGTQRFAPLNSWPDNANLDKARRLLWPLKQKYGKQVSWADLMLFAGNCAIESMGLPTAGFAFGREDVWEPEEDIYWGPEGEWLGDERYSGERDLENPLAAVQMGLIYVNPEGPNCNADPLAAAVDIRETFGRMAMNDEETVALIAGGHTFGKAHGAANPDEYVGPEPEGATIEEVGLGWTNKFGSGAGKDTITSGLEGAWTHEPTKWDNGYFDNLFSYDWKQVKSPAGATQWVPEDESAVATVPDAHDPEAKHAPIMFTTDLSLKLDPIYGPISKRFHESPDEFAKAFANAWYKLIHRDMGPPERLHGPMLPAEPFVWQDPVPKADHDLIDDSDIAALKEKLLGCGLTVQQLVTTAWASASTFRCTDCRGGANGARIRLEPQKNWEVNNPTELATVLETLEAVQSDFNGSAGGNKKVSLADIIVLGGCAGIEKAAKDAGHDVTVPFTPGRTDASQDDTDVESVAYLEPIADGFRNYQSKNLSQSAEEALIDTAQKLSLTGPEMTVLIGGLRSINTNYDKSDLGVLTEKPGTLNNDFFVNLLDLNTKWAVSPRCEHFFEGKVGGSVKWTGSRVDLVFASNSQLRALAEVYACNDAKDKFIADFVKTWDKVMNADRFDLHA